MAVPSGSVEMTDPCQGFHGDTQGGAGGGGGAEVGGWE